MSAQRNVVLLALFCFFCFKPFYSNALPQLDFVVSVNATFDPTFNEPCDYCDTASQTYYQYPNTICATAIPGNPPPDDCQQRWGSAGGSYYCFASSGAGFRGLQNVTLTSNPTNDSATKIGEYTHYNNEISGGSPSKLRLTMTITSSQLTQPFIIAYPLGFFETSNCGSLSCCDPSIQYSQDDCDDRFSFNTQLTQTSSFVFQNVRYTLEIAGFMQGSGATPVRYFSTVETNASRADVYARLVTVCDSTVCSDNEQFFTENCTCGCLITEKLCTETFGPNWTANSTGGCDCVCALNETTANCANGTVWNADSCSCGCNLTDAYCETIDPTYEVIGSGQECECGCPRDIALYCVRLLGRFYVPAGNSCECACAVTDAKCVDAYGEGYEADVDKCGCVLPGGGGLSDGDIAGIVVGTVVGGSAIAGLFIAGGALLVYLIRSGRIAGIYGYKLEPALLDGVNESPLYNSPWSNTNALNS